MANDLATGLKRKKQLLTRKIKTLPETHKAWKKAVRDLQSNTAQRQALKRAN